MDCCAADATTVGAVQRDCPRCGTRGRRVPEVTLNTLLRPDARSDAGVQRFCRNRACEVVYFGEKTGSVVGREALIVRVGQKETAADRPLCYCFGFSASDVQAEVRATGTSTIPDRIAEHCRRGEDRCPETNPQGSCCLGNVRAVVEDARAERASEACACATDS